MLGALQASGSDSSDPMGGEGKGKVGYSGRGMLQYSLKPERKPSEQEAVSGEPFPGAGQAGAGCSSEPSRNTFSGERCACPIPICCSQSPAFNNADVNLPAVEGRGWRGA